MKNSLKPSKKGKGVAASIVVCFVAAIAMVGTYTFNQYKDGMNEELAQLEEESTTKEESKSTSVGQDLVINTPEQKVVEEPQIEPTPEVIEEKPVVEEPVKQAPAKSHQLDFNEKNIILWPVDGDVLINYSMDKTVYFSTLDQYKYNPALIIGGAVGDQVLSVARGVVKSIDVTAQTGTTVTVDLGNGYEAIYGQLKEVPVKTGDYVEAKTILGYLSEPTKYYSVEGCNLYFEMRKDAQPINPLEYLGE